MRLISNHFKSIVAYNTQVTNVVTKQDVKDMDKVGYPYSLLLTKLCNINHTPQTHTMGADNPECNSFVFDKLWFNCFLLP